MTDTLTIASGATAVTVRPSTGRITSLRIADVEHLHQGERFGSFPMAPWCGRLRDGVLDFAGERYEFPRNDAPHAIHGTVRDHPWDIVERTDGSLTLTQDLQPRWPLPGSVTQSFTVSDSGLSLAMTVRATDQPFPAQVGWHPWFRRTLDDAGEPLRIHFSPAWQEERGDDYLPTGRRIDPLPSPWDDCFGMPDGVDVTCEWPGARRIRIRSDARWVVAYDMRDFAICVEPQSGPPNGLNTDPRVVSPDDDLVVTTTWTW
ncbi:aldose 1-epimerase [Gordonia sp. TBRC 11910]|uniref:Aldose 1-epimerase n=1 Tax=Gordonia asplenii TaxID=2725283 RepID=A0A848KUB5_9ACTN|nr:aldose 1-epimerase [Gordonia asplenii]NMO01809.1 aldose 1-epimerase [Gordonia asplenii]